jgi:hypothetical protein
MIFSVDILIGMGDINSIRQRRRQMQTRRQIDRTSIEYLEMRTSMMSNESLREIAKRRDVEGSVARRELARRDLEIGLAE